MQWNRISCDQELLPKWWVLSCYHLHAKPQLFWYEASSAWQLVNWYYFGPRLLKLYTQVQISFGGPKPALRISASDCIKTDMVPRLFDLLTNECKPIITKLRKHSIANEKFIAKTIKSDLVNGVIESSTTPWRAQVLVTAEENHRKRMFIGYSETINKYTLLDDYPLPNLQNMVIKIAQYSYFSTLDFRTAYYQVKISEKDRPFTAFKANGKLY